MVLENEQLVEVCRYERQGQTPAGGLGQRARGQQGDKLSMRR